MSSTRPIAIRNAHPRLRIPRGAVAKIITLLDEQFAMLPGDLPHLSLLRPRHVLLQSKIQAVCPTGELSLVFLTDPAIAQIHADFMADPTATDVITFEGDATAELAGEICISADTAARYVGLPLAGMPSPGRRPAPALQISARAARPQGPALQKSFATELTLYIVHGWLHLSGYDDLKPAKKRRMRAAEKRAMTLLSQAKAIPAFRLV